MPQGSSLCPLQLLRVVGHRGASLSIRLGLRGEVGADVKRILGADYFASNAQIIECCARLGYLRVQDLVLDPTYAQGNWWTLFRPTALVTHCRPQDGVDIRSLPWPDNHFTAAVEDLPYVAKGGRDTSGIREMDDRYGQHDCPPTPALLQELINDGLDEVSRVVEPAHTKKLHPLKPNGIILVKCQSYVSSGELWDGVYLTKKHAERLGLALYDFFEHLSKGGRAQDTNRTRKHAACKGLGCQDCTDGREPSQKQHAIRNHSTLLVFRKMA